MTCPSCHPDPVIQSSHWPVPVIQLYIEHDCPEDECRLQQYSLGILRLSTKQGHLSIAGLLAGDLFDVLDELYLVSLAQWIIHMLWCQPYPHAMMSALKKASNLKDGSRVWPWTRLKSAGQQDFNSRPGGKYNLAWYLYFFSFLQHKVISLRMAGVDGIWFWLGWGAALEHFQLENVILIIISFTDLVYSSIGHFSRGQFLGIGCHACQTGPQYVLLVSERDTTLKHWHTGSVYWRMPHRELVLQLLVRHVPVGKLHGLGH